MSEPGHTSKPKKESEQQKRGASFNEKYSTSPSFLLISRMNAEIEPSFQRKPLTESEPNLARIPKGMSEPRNVRKPAPESALQI